MQPINELNSLFSNVDASNIVQNLFYYRENYLQLVWFKNPILLYVELGIGIFVLNK